MKWNPQICMHACTHIYRKRKEVANVQAKSNAVAFSKCYCKQFLAGVSHSLAAEWWPSGLQEEMAIAEFDFLSKFSFLKKWGGCEYVVMLVNDVGEWCWCWGSCLWGCHCWLGMVVEPYVGIAAWHMSHQTPQVKLCLLRAMTVTTVVSKLWLVSHIWLFDILYTVTCETMLAEFLLASQLK